MYRLLETDGEQLYHPSLEKMAFHHTKWLDVENPTDFELFKISEMVGVEKEELQNYLDRDELPRIGAIGNFLVIIYKSPIHLPNKKSLASASVTYLVSEKLLITLHKDKINTFQNVLSSPIESMQKLLAKGTDKLLYFLLERTTNQYFESLDEIEDQINKIEDTVFSHPNQKTVKKIFRLKRTLIYFHKSLSANRDVLVSLQKDGGVEEYTLDKSTKNMLNNLYYDVIQLLDVVATYRDILTGALDIYLSAISNNMNAVMKKMAAYGTLVLVPTFITGLYGMNFWNMPELQWKYGYYFAWAMIIGSVIALVVYFKKQDWF